MKRLMSAITLLALLAIAPAAMAQMRGVPLFANPSNGPGQPTQAGWVWTGMPTQPSGSGYNLFSNRPVTAGAPTPGTAGGTGNTITQIPGTVFRGPIFVPPTFSFR